MEPFPTFPANKRHAMHFRKPTVTDAYITARFPDPKTAHLSPGNVSISTVPTSIAMQESLDRDAPPQVPPDCTKPSPPVRQPLPRSQSSSWWMEIRKSPSGKKEPRSRKTSEATIQTDATDTQPAFESDAFAVHMPTTREPILDPPVFRAKLPSPSKAQVEAYQTYKEKAEHIREQQHSEGVRVPSKIMSYDYAYEKAQALELDVSPPTSPPNVALAGAFPASPPVPQHEWARPAQQVRGPRSMSDVSHNLDRKVATVTLRKAPTAAPPAVLPPDPPLQQQRYYQRNVDTDPGALGASSTPTPSVKAPTITVRIKPRATTVTTSESTSPASSTSSSPQKWIFTPRSAQPPSSNSSRSASPTKPATFLFTSANGLSETSPTRANFMYTTAEPTVFEHGNADNTGTVAGAKRSRETSPSKGLGFLGRDKSGGKKDKEKSKDKDKPKEKPKEKAKDKPKEKPKDKPKEKDHPTTPSKPSPSKWAWLRPLTTTPVTISPPKPPVTKTSPPRPRPAIPAHSASPAPLPTPLTGPRNPSVYIDPFTSLPPPPIPPSPLPARSPKLTRPAHLTTTTTAASPSKSYQSGLTQLSRLATLIAKVLLVLYILVGLYYLLDALRETVHVLGMPWRVGCVVGAWVWWGVKGVGGVVGRIGGKALRWVGERVGGWGWRGRRWW